VKVSDSQQSYSPFYL